MARRVLGFLLQEYSYKKMGTFFPKQHATHGSDHTHGMALLYLSGTPTLVWKHPMEMFRELWKTIGSLPFDEGHYHDLESNVQMLANFFCSEKVMDSDFIMARLCPFVVPGRVVGDSGDDLAFAADPVKWACIVLTEDMDQSLKLHLASQWPLLFLKVLGGLRLFAPYAPCVTKFLLRSWRGYISVEFGGRRPPLCTSVSWTDAQTLFGLVLARVVRHVTCRVRMGKLADVGELFRRDGVMCTLLRCITAVRCELVRLRPADMPEQDARTALLGPLVQVIMEEMAKLPVDFPPRLGFGFLNMCLKIVGHHPEMERSSRPCVDLEEVHAAVVACGLRREMAVFSLMLQLEILVVRHKRDLPAKFLISCFFLYLPLFKSLAVDAKWLTKGSEDQGDPFLFKKTDVVKCLLTRFNLFTASFASSAEGLEEMKAWLMSFSVEVSS